MIKKLLRQTTPRFVWDQEARWRLVQSSLDRLGYTVARKSDYYSPLPSVPRLRAKLDRWNRPSSLKGIRFEVKEMEARLSRLLSQYLAEFLALPPYEEMQAAGFGPGYTELDALTLYLMIRHLKPRRYIEIGSGLSTYYCSLAGAKNADENWPVSITCIEPNPFEKLNAIAGIEVIQKEVQDVEPAFFEQLRENDVLFIDSSHVLKIDGDVAFLYLEVLPSLERGSAIHIHDVPFPFNIPYPPEHWILETAWPVFWTEAMLLQAFLCFNDKFAIEMSTPLIRYFDEPFLKRNVPNYQSRDENPNAFSSLWLRRIV